MNNEKVKELNKFKKKLEKLESEASTLQIKIYKDVLDYPFDTYPHMINDEAKLKTLRNDIVEVQRKIETLEHSDQIKSETTSVFTDITKEEKENEKSSEILSPIPPKNENINSKSTKDTISDISIDHSKIKYAITLSTISLSGIIGGYVYMKKLRKKKNV